jgi:hypothetical protein
MRPELAKKILVDHVHHVTSYYEAIAPLFPPEHIHTFRTHVKKLRAFLRFLSSTNKELQLPESCQTAYHIAGYIREAQVEEKWLAQKQILFPGYVAQLQETIEHYKQQWHAHYTPRFLHEWIKDVQQTNIPEISTKDLHHFFGTHLRSIHKIIQHQPDNEQIHTCRKYVKDMLYISSIADKEWRYGYKELSKLPLEELHTLSEKLGDYNDGRMMLEHFMQFSAYTSVDAAIQNSICTEIHNSLQTKKKRLLVCISNFLQATHA